MCARWLAGIADRMILLISKWGCFADASLIADDLVIPVRDVVIPVAA